MNIAIVEDDDVAFNTLKSYLQRLQESINEDIVIIRYENAERFLVDSLVRKDIIFMDIALPGMNGMDAALEYRKTDRQAILIFVTSMAQFAIKGYEAEAMDFLVKPLNFYDFSMKIKRAFSKLKDRESDSLVIQHTGRT